MFPFAVVTDTGEPLADLRAAPWTRLRAVQTPEAGLALVLGRTTTHSLISRPDGVQQARYADRAHRTVGKGRSRIRCEEELGARIQARCSVLPCQTIARSIWQSS